MLSLDNAGWICTHIMIAYHPALLLITTLTGLGVLSSAGGRGLINQTYATVSPETLSVRADPQSLVAGDLPWGLVGDRANAFPTPDPSGLPSPNPDSPVLATQDSLELAQNQPKPPTPDAPRPKNRFARKDLIWLLFLGLGTLAFAGIFAGAFYLLTRPSDPGDDADSEEIPETPGAFKDPPDQFSVSDPKPELELPVSNGSDLPGNPPVPLHPHNGYNEAAIEPAQKLPPSAATPPPSSEGLVPRQPPQLAKIDGIETLIEELQSRMPTQRRKAIWELGLKGDSRAVQPLVNLLMDSDSKQRSLILASLAEIGNRTFQPMNRALVLSLQDSNPEVRKNAIRDLTRIYELVSQSSQLLRHASEDSDPEVREAAQWALSQLNRIRPGSNSESRSSLQNWSPPSETYPEDIP